MKPKIHKLDDIKLKSFCTVNKLINKMERQLTEQEKILVSGIYITGFTFKVCMELIQSNIKKTTQLKMGRGPG